MVRRRALRTPSALLLARATLALLALASCADQGETSSGADAGLDATYDLNVPEWGVEATPDSPPPGIDAGPSCPPPAPASFPEGPVCTPDAPGGFACPDASVSGWIYSCVDQDAGSTMPSDAGTCRPFQTYDYADASYTATICDLVLCVPDPDRNDVCDGGSAWACPSAVFDAGAPAPPGTCVQAAAGWASALGSGIVRCCQ